MKKTSRILCIILSVILIVALFPLNTIAETVSGSSDGIEWSYEVSSGELLITGSGAMPEFTSSTVPWYNYRGTIKRVEITGEITSISPYAFNACSKMEEITIADSVVSIGNNAFAQCQSLKTIDLPESLESIGDNVFNKCSSLNTITIPAKVSSIGAQVFTYCTSLNEINVNDLNESFSSIDGVLFDKSGKKLITFPMNKTESYTVPDGVTEIGSRAFYGSSVIKEVVLPDSMEILGAYAFNGCTNLETIKLNDGLIKMDNNCFFACTSLKEILIPETVASLGYYCFQGNTLLESVVIPTSVTILPKYIFSGCTALTEVTIPTSITYINNGAFKDCTALTDIYYLGTEDEWAALQVSEVDNSYFTSATVHFTEAIEYCTVTFDSNGGITEYEPIEVEKGTAIGTLPEAPETETSETFAGWFTEDGVKVTEDTVILEDTVLYAHWNSLAIKSFEVTSLPERTEYYIGEELELAGAEFTITYIDDSTKMAEFEELEFEYNFSEIGATRVTVYYTENDVTFSAYIDVNIIARTEFYSQIASVTAGQEVVIPIEIAGNSGLNGFGLNIMYDTEIFTFVDATLGAIMTDDYFEYNNDAETGNLHISWNSASTLYGDGEILNLVFYVNKNATDTTVIEIMHSPEETYNEDGYVFIFDCGIALSIEQLECDYDITGDGNIDVRDLVRLKKIIAGLEDDINGNANLDGEGDIDSADLIMLRKKILEDYYI